MSFDTLGNFLPIIIFSLIVILSVVKKNKKTAKKNGRTPSPPGTNVKTGKSSGFTVREMTREKTDLSGKVHSPGHAHDRLDFDCYVPENQAEHYRKQLQSFLEAGLIEKAEYREIIERYTNQGIL